MPTVQDPFSRLEKQVAEHGTEIKIAQSDIRAIEVAVRESSSRIEAVRGEIFTMVSTAMELFNRVDKKLIKHEYLDGVLILLAVAIIVSVWVK